MRLGMFDPPGPYTKIGIDQINTPAAQELALRNAQEGIVLLKNVNNALPLKPDQSSTVAVIGPNAQATTVMQGTVYYFLFFF
jgi:beta-D-xylosidase 4